MVHHQHLPQPATTRCTGLTSASEDRKRSAEPIVPGANGISIKWYAVPACLQRQPSQERATRVQSRSRRAFSSSCGQHWLVCLAVSASTCSCVEGVVEGVVFAVVPNKPRTSAIEPILYRRRTSRKSGRCVQPLWYSEYVSPSPCCTCVVQQLSTLVACGQLGHPPPYYLLVSWQLLASFGRLLKLHCCTI